MASTIKWFRELGMQDVATVGGKNASLGEMIQTMSEGKISATMSHGICLITFRIG